MPISRAGLFNFGSPTGRNGAILPVDGASPECPVPDHIAAVASPIGTYCGAPGADLESLVEVL